MHITTSTFLRSILGMPLTRILRLAAQEHPVAAIFRVASRAYDRLRGRFAATIVGWPKSYLGAGSRVLGTRSILVDKNISMGRYAWIEAVSGNNGHKFNPTIKIGQGFCASERLHISAINRIDIADNCLFGSCVYISDHNHGSYKGEVQSHPSEPPIQRKLVSHGPVVIGSNVWIGDNVVIVGPVRIGNGVVVGANSVVTRDIPDGVMVVGIPAKILKRFDQESGKWKNEACRV